MGKIGEAVGTKGIDLCGKVRGKCEELLVEDSHVKIYVDLSGIKIR